MQDYNAEIKIENKQSSEDGDEAFSVNVPCKFFMRGEKAYILYKDDGITTKIKADNKIVTVTRMGEFSSEMIYKQGEITSFLYKMPYGEMEMDLKSNRVEVEISENGGSIFLDYELIFSGTRSKNSMKMTINLK